MKLPKRKETKWAKKREKRIPNENSPHYQSRYWRAKRKSFWSNPINQICVMCKKPREKYFQIDHINPISKGCDLGTFIKETEEGGLQALCISCHAEKSAKERWNK